MPQFGLKDLEATFRALASKLSTPADAYLLGGGAMAILGAKDATKDVDLVFQDQPSLDHVEQALVRMDAQSVRDPAHRASRPGARRFWLTPDGMGWDLFLRNVVGFPLDQEDFGTAKLWM